MEELRGAAAASNKLTEGGAGGPTHIETRIRTHVGRCEGHPSGVDLRVKQVLWSETPGVVVGLSVYEAAVVFPNIFCGT